jgi:hypothetical protein
LEINPNGPAAAEVGELWGFTWKRLRELANVSEWPARFRGLTLFSVENDSSPDDRSGVARFPISRTGECGVLTKINELLHCIGLNDKVSKQTTRKDTTMETNKALVVNDPASLCITANPARQTLRLGYKKQQSSITGGAALLRSKEEESCNRPPIEDQNDHEKQN